MYSNIFPEKYFSLGYGVFWLFYFVVVGGFFVWLGFLFFFSFFSPKPVIVFIYFLKTPKLSLIQRLTGQGNR